MLFNFQGAVSCPRRDSFVIIALEKPEVNRIFFENNGKSIEQKSNKLFKTTNAPYFTEFWATLFTRRKQQGIPRSLRGGPFAAGHAGARDGALFGLPRGGGLGGAF
jgi:hypothetical protein